MRSLENAKIAEKLASAYVRELLKSWQALYLIVHHPKIRREGWIWRNCLIVMYSLLYKKISFELMRRKKMLRVFQIAKPKNYIHKEGRASKL